MKPTRNALLLVAGVLTLGLVPIVYAKLRRKPLPYSEEARKRRRLSVALDCATESVRTQREAA